jgi:hypothetical protein
LVRTDVERAGELRNTLATLIVNAELVLVMDEEAARDRVARVVAAAWDLHALLDGPARPWSARLRSRRQFRAG